MIICIIFALVLLIGGIFIYIKQKDTKKIPGKLSDYHDHTKKNILERLLKCFHRRKGLTPSGGTDISDQPLTGLLDEFSTSTMGPGKEISSWY